MSPLTHAHRGGIPKPRALRFVRAPKNLNPSRSLSPLPSLSPNEEERGDEGNLAARDRGRRRTRGRRRWLAPGPFEMEYISPERNLEGTCGDPGPLFGDQDGSLLDHLDYQGGGIPQHESPTLDDGLLVDPVVAIPYLSTDSLPFMNDQITCSVMKSIPASPESSLKQVQEHLNVESVIQHDVSGQNIHNGNSEELVTEVVGSVLPPEVPESIGNDTSNFQQETTYHGDSLLAEINNKDCQLNNSSAADDENPNSPVPQMEHEDMENLHETSRNEKSGSEDDQMNGRKSSPIDGRDRENFDTSVEPPSWEQMEQENSGTRNGSSTPENQSDSTVDRFARLERDTPSPDGRASPDRFARLERDTPSPDGRVSPPVRSPHAHHHEKAESQRHAKDVGDLAHSESPPARHRCRSSEKHDPSRKRASSREMSPHGRHQSPVERKRRRESRHGDGSPQRRSKAFTKAQVTVIKSSTGDSRGFGFLSLEKDEDADAAIRACDETEWNGRIILVEKSKAPACSLTFVFAFIIVLVSGSLADGTNRYREIQACETVATQGLS
nr:unnamed protein product [Digitaria exilis]